ncbi:MAG: 7-carboxy-7-deazaguanine synthase QueE [Chitinophagales bacterium]
MIQLEKKASHLEIPANGEILPVMEIFYSLQGEGYHQGKSATFIRLAGCSIGCVWCDVKESWKTDDYPLQTVSDIINEIKSFPSRLVIITGGEPLMYNLTPLTQILKENGFQVHLETSGAFPLSGIWDWICVSPKKFKSVLPEILPQAHELKVVVYHPSDITWANSFLPSVNAQCKLYLQPEWSKHQHIEKLLVAHIQENPQWRLSLQVHKYLNIR